MLKIPKNSAQNLYFWLIFGTFSITPSYALSFMPQFLYQIKGLQRCTIVVKFHLYSISGCEVKKFEMFSWRWSIHEMTHFLVFLGPKSPKCGPVLLKFAPQLLPKESKTLFEEFFENSNFYRKRTFRKFALFFSFCPTAEIEKTKYSSGQNYAIGLSKNRKVKALSCPNFS